MNTWDYIVVGAGHNGLSAACTLAMAGHSVLVLEQRGMIGGMAASYPYLKSAPEHLLSIGAMDDAFYSPSGLAKEFDLGRFGYNPIPLEHPYGWTNEDGDTLLLFSNFEKTLKEIKYYSPKDAKAYAELRSTFEFIADGIDRFGATAPDQIGKIDLVKTLYNVVRDKTIKKNLGRMISTSAFEMVSECFESESMRGLWAYWMSMSCPATVDGTGIFASAFANVHRGGIFRPQGGMTALVGGMAKLLASHGGEVRTATKVKQITVNSNGRGSRATGVLLEGGDVITAKKGVLANCAPQIALGELLETGVLPKVVEDSLKFIPANSVGVAPFKIDMAVGGKLAYGKAMAKRAARDDVDLRKATLMTGTLEDHLAQHSASIRGEVYDGELPLYFSILSGADPSVAPDEGDVFYLYANSPLNPKQGWNQLSAEYERRVMQGVAKYVDGFENEVGRVVTNPDGFISEFSAPNACYFHVDSIPSRLGGNRPTAELGGYSAPVEGLFLASSGCHPSGGVTGLPGHLAAKHVLKQ